MRAQNSNDVFYITLSKWKVWVFSIFFWILACLPLFAIFEFAEDELRREQALISNLIPVIATFGLMFLVFAAIPFILLTKINKPIVTLTRNGFSGLENLRNQRFAWTPNTIIYGNRLANIDVNQSRTHAMWIGLKAVVVIHHVFAKQKRQDVWDAINRLSPYPVKVTSLWRATKY